MRGRGAGEERAMDSVVETKGPNRRETGAEPTRGGSPLQTRDTAMRAHSRRKRRLRVYPGAFGDPLAPDRAVYRR
jgi:hypothetical protein